MNLRVVSDSSRSKNVSGKVLVVDDDAMQVEEIVDFLNDHDIPAIGESNPEAAVAIIDRERPALLVIDVNMPTIDGVRVTQVLRALNYNGVILLISGDLDAVRRAHEAGPEVFAVLTKPIPLPALERYARAVLARDVH
jgi:DNA-binding response OmpR family regulator